MGNLTCFEKNLAWTEDHFELYAISSRTMPFLSLQAGNLNALHGTSLPHSYYDLAVILQRRLLKVVELGRELCIFTVNELHGHFEISGPSFFIGQTIVTELSLRKEWLKKDFLAALAWWMDP